MVSISERGGCSFIDKEDEEELISIIEPLPFLVSIFNYLENCCFLLLHMHMYKLFKYKH